MSERPATVVIDDLHITFRVLVGGGTAPETRRLLKRGPRLRGVREVHAVRGISLVAREGDAIGVVGRNGSGKSTLMRAIAGMQTPTRGRVYAEGRPALLGVNAALIPELSGERNVVLGGLALGLSPRQVQERYQEIVDFADIGEFIDYPMRTYSSGMQARLRFAIATATTQRVLLIDEALATGDAEFRERSEERIREMRDRAGTVFLVTHTLAEIERSCNRCVWIDDGRLRMDGEVDAVLDAYREATQSGRLGRLGRPGRPARPGPHGDAGGEG